MKKLLIALMFVPAMAQAEFMTGNKLLRDMQSDNAVDRLVALGYVQGVFDSHQRVTHCPPENSSITAGQVRDIAQKYLENNPSIRHKNADFLVSEIFKAVWPCPKRGTPI